MFHSAPSLLLHSPSLLFLLFAHLSMVSHYITPQLEEDFIKANPEWVAELELMLRTREKAEIQALSSFGFQYLTHEYLPRKLAEGDWL